MLFKLSAEDGEKMGMEVDSLEIGIQSNADKASKSLDNLITKLGVMAKGISAISSGDGFKDFLKEVEKISSSMSGVSDSTKKMTDGVKEATTSASNSMKQVSKATDDVKKRLGDTLKEISERTSGITPKLDMGNLDKEMSKYEKQFRDAGNLLNRILESSTADKQTAGIERLIIKINEAKNALREIERIQNETSKVSTPEVNIPISTEETKRSLEDIVDELDEFFLAVRQNSDYKPFSAIQSSLDELKSKFPEATEEIKFFESELEEVYSKKYSTQSYGDVTKEVDKIEQEIFGAKEKAEELDNVFANIHPLEFKGDNFFEMEKWVDDLTNKLNVLLNRQEKMSALGTKVDSKPMQSMAYDIEQLTKTLDVYEAKLEEARARGELDIKIPNIDAPIDKIVGKTKVLRDSVSDIKVSLSSPSLKQVERQIENIKKKYEEVVASIERGAANKDFFGATPEFKRKTAELSAMRQKYQDLMQIQKELSLSGQTADRGKADGKAKTQANSFQATVNAISETAKNLERVVLNVKKHIDNLIRSIARLVSNGFKKLAGSIRSAVSNVAKFTGAIAKMIKENKRANKSFDFSFKTILKYAFGILSLFVLVNRLRSATKEGIDNLVQYSGQLNYSVSIMTSALGALKNGFASAFAPIINVVAPYIAKFTNMMIDATNAIARFFSALTGHSTAVQAKKYYQDYAESLGGVTDEAKKAGKALHTLGIDELNILSETNKDKDELLPEDMFETVKITGDIADWAKKLRDAFLNQDWEGLGRTIAELINKGLEWLYKKIKQITPKVEKALENLAKVINSFIKNLDWDLLGRTIGAGINLLTKAFNALFGDDGINLELLGQKLSVGIRGMIDEVDWRELGNAIGNYLMIAWRIAYGFIEDMWRIDPKTMLTGWAEAGNAIGDTLVGIFERINFEQIAAVLTEGFKGALETITYALNRFSENLDWIVEKINLGLDRLYDGLKWDSTAGENMGQKITAFTDAIATAFNKLLDLDFGKVGQIIGAAVTDIVRAFNQLTDIDTGGMDFEKLGKKISEGLRGLVTEIPWEEFGNALGNGFMVAWRILDGFLTDMAKKSNAGLTGWQEIGKAIADTINGLFDKFDLGKVASAISRLVNGIFDTLKQAVADIRWDDIADNLARGLNGLIEEIHWKENGQTLNNLFTELLGMLLKAAQNVKWEELGKQIGIFLGQIDWAKHFKTALDTVLEVIGGLLDGFGQTTVGKIAEGLAAGFAAFKVADAFSPLIELILNFLGIKGPLAKAIAGAIPMLISGIVAVFVGGQELVDAVSGMINGFIEKMIEAVKNADWSQVWHNIVSTLGSVLTNLPEIAGNLVALAFELAGHLIGGLVEYIVSGQAIADLAEFGVNLIAGLVKGILAAIGGLAEALKAIWDGLVNGLKKLFGIHSPSTVMAEIGVNIMEGLINGIKSLLEAVVGVVKGVVDAVLGAWQGVKEKTEQVWNAVRDAVVAIWTGIRDKATEVFSGISDFLKRTFEGVKEGWTQVWDFLIGFLSQTWNTIVDTAKSVFGNVVEFLKGVFESIKEAWSAVWQFLSDFLSNTWNFITETAQSVFSGIGEFLEKVFDTLSEIWQNVWNFLSEFLSGIWNTITEAAHSIFEGISEFLSGLFDTVAGIWETVWTTIHDVVTGIWNKIKEVATEVFNGIKETVLKTWTNIKEKTTELWGAVKKFVGDAIDAIKGWIVEKLGYAADFIKNAWETVVSKTKEAWEGLKTFLFEFIPNMIEKIVGFFAELPGKMFEIAKNVIMGFVNGIKDFAEKAFDSVREFAGGVIDKVKGVLGIHSPSKVFEEIGGNTVQGYIEGFDQNAGKVTDSAKRIAEDSIRAFDGTDKEFNYIGSNMVGSLDAGIMKEMQGIRDAMMALMNSIRSSFSDLATNFQGIGENLMQGFLNGVNSKLGDIGNVATNVIKGFKNALGIHSPSTVFAELGDYSMQGFVKGMSEKEGLIRNAALGIADEAKSALESAGDFGEVGTSMMDSLISSMEKADIEKIGGKISSRFASGMSITPPNPTFTTPDSIINHSTENMMRQRMEYSGEINGRSSLIADGKFAEAIEEAAYRGFLRAQEEASPYLADIAEYTRITSEKDMSVNIGDRDIYEANQRGESRYGVNFRATPT